jgi:MinD-like ATPase involved in chromosome partitioning or flagellar assembly
MPHLPLLLALGGTDHEERLVAHLQRSPGPIRIVRRCLDLTDLLAAATLGSAQVAIVAATLSRLDVEAVASLQASGLRVFGVLDADDHGQSQRMHALGVLDLVPVARGESGEAIATALLAALAGPPAEAHLVSAASTDPVAERPRGRVVAVWGPVGAPGRTTVATVVADELARLRVETLLIDADTYGPAVAQTLGVLDEASGLAAAVRDARGGSLDVDRVAAWAVRLRPQLRLLTGVTRADRWPELPASALAIVLRAARALASWTVVDCAFCLEQDEELSFDTAAPRRNAATLATLGEADVVLAVGSADPIGLSRLIRALPEMRACAPQAKVRAVINQVRRGAVGRNPERRIAESLAQHAGVSDPVLVPYDRAALDAALVAGRVLGDEARSSPVRIALSKLAGELATS